MSYKTNVRKSMKLSVLFIFLMQLLSDLNAQNQNPIQSIRQHYNYVNRIFLFGCLFNSYWHFDSHPTKWRPYTLQLAIFFDLICFLIK